MRVGYDLTPLQLNWAGERRATLELLTALRRRGDTEVETLALAPRRPRTTLQSLAFQAAAEALFYPLGVPRAARRRSLDLVHYPRQTVVPALGMDVPTVVTVHDVFPFTHPHLYTQAIRRHHQLLVPGAARRAARVIVPSEYSRRSVAELFGLPPERIAVTPWGIDRRFEPRPRDPVWLRDRFAFQGPYVACVGTLEPRKNLSLLLDAFRRLPPEYAGHRLALIGGAGWMVDTFGDAIAALGDRLVLIGYVEDEALVRLVGGADCFVHPALIEGFGFPVLEAMACGTPVVSSNGGSLAEVVGDAGLLVEPTDPDALADAIARVLGDPELAADLRERGLARAAGFTWEECAERTVRVYEEAVAA